MNSSSTDLTAAEAAIEELLSCPPGLTVTGREAREVLGRVAVLQRQLEAVRLGWVQASLDADTRAGVGTGPGGARRGGGPAGPTRAFIATGLREGAARAAADLDAARLLAPVVGELAEVGRVLAAGATTREHVDHAVAAVDDLPAAVRRDCHERIVDVVTAMVCELDPAGVRTAGRHLLSRVRPDTEESFDPDACERRALRVGTDSSGVVHTRGVHDPASGQFLTAVLNALSHRDRPVPVPDLPDSPVSEPPGRGGQGAAAGVADTRTPAMRRHDALMEVVRAGAHALASTEHSERLGAALTRVLVVTTPDELRSPDRHTTSETGSDVPGLAADDDVVNADVGEGQDEQDGEDVAPVATGIPGAGRGGGTAPVTRGTLNRLVCDGVLDRITTTGTGRVLSMVTLGRLATPAITRALVARDGGCTFPSCTRAPVLCDAHHVLWWTRGGRTDVDNLTLLCSAHHTLVHTETWVVAMRDGLPWFRPPGADTWIRGNLTDHLTRTRRLAARLRHALDDSG